MRGKPSLKRQGKGCSCQGAAKQELVLLHPTGLALESYETGEFFTELFEEVFTGERRRWPETGIFGQETWKK